MPRVARPHVARAPQGPKYLRPLNQKQINRLATKQTAAAVAAAQAPILSQESMAQARQAAAQKAIAGFSAAASGLYTKPADVQRAYSDAAHETADFAGAFTSEAGKQLSAAEQANAAYMDQQTPGAAPQNEPNVPAGQDAAYYLSGYNPSALLSSEGAAAAGTAAGLPLLQQARGEQDLMASQAKAQEEDQQYTQAMLDLAAKEPDMRNQIMQTLYNREQQKFNMRIQQQAQDLYQEKFGVQTRQENQRIAISRKNAQISAQRLRVAEQQGNARLSLQAAGLRLSQQKQRFAVRQALKDGRRIDSSASHAAGYLIDKDGDPILGGNGKRIPVQASSSGGGARGGVGSTGYHEAVRATPHLMPVPTPVPDTSLYSGQYKYIAQAGKGTFVQGSGWYTNDPTEAKMTGKYTFPEAVKYVMNAYGLNRAAARKALIAGGWKPDGKRPPKTAKS